MIHIPASTSIYIDDAGAEETRIIMRAELVAIHTALSTFSTHNWISIFTHSPYPASTSLSITIPTLVQ